MINHGNLARWRTSKTKQQCILICFSDSNSHNDDECSDSDYAFTDSDGHGGRVHRILSGAVGRWMLGLLRTSVEVLLISSTNGTLRLDMTVPGSGPIITTAWACNRDGGRKRGPEYARTL